MGDWGSTYDGFDNIGKKPRKQLVDRHGRKVPMDPTRDLPMTRFMKNIDMDCLVAFMEFNEKYEYFIRDLVNPHYPGRKVSFNTLCRRHNISLHEMQVLYTDGMRQLGLLQISTHLPKIMQDVGEDAESRLVSCGRCDGQKTLVENELDEDGKIVGTTSRPCPTCEGVGKVRQVGDKQSRDLVFESMKLTKQGGPMVAIQQNFGNSADGLDVKMEGLMKATQGIVMERKALGEGEQESEQEGE